MTSSNPVRWSSFADTDQATPREWCDAVGPALRMDGGAPAPTADELVVATWNVHVGGGDIVRFVDDLKSGALTGRPVQSFVLLLQEAYRAGADVPSPPTRSLVARIDEAPPSGERIDVAEAARSLGLHLFYAPSMPNGLTAGDGALPEDRGNAILSTFPLADPGRQPVRHGRRIEQV